MAKKQKLVDLEPQDKVKVRKVVTTTLVGVAIVCCILVGCFACSQDSGLTAGMTSEQKASYWKANTMDVRWTPMTDASHDGILKGLLLPRDAVTGVDSVTGAFMIYFMFDEDDVMDSAVIELNGDSGNLKFVTEDQWSIKFSEKNDIMYMTIKDSDGKEVFYQNT